MKQYGVEISDAMHICNFHGFGKECISFVEYLVDQVIHVHNEEKPVQPPNEIPGSYNPEKGAAYYFTPH